jgi:hypothetical protein
MVPFSENTNDRPVERETKESTYKQAAFDP